MLSSDQVMSETDAARIEKLIVHNFPKLCAMVLPLLLMAENERLQAATGLACERLL